MGFDLKLLATHFRERPTEMFATASIRLDRDERLLSQLSMESIPRLVKLLPPDFKVGHHDDKGLRYDDKDGHGNALTFTTPAQVRALRDVESLCEWNKAALKFVM